jgi:hypothetical protein
MRYWAWFVAKLAVSVAGLYGLLSWVARTFPPETNREAPLTDGANYLLCDLALMLCFLLFAGAIALNLHDQRYRCRVCLRKLRMPIETGSWGSILERGRPRIEYICLYGHGTLREDEIQITGRSAAEWTANSDDIWAELCAPGKDSDRP